MMVSATTGRSFRALLLAGVAGLLTAPGAQAVGICPSTGSNEITCSDASYGGIAPGPATLSLIVNGTAGAVQVGTLGVSMANAGIGDRSVETRGTVIINSGGIGIRVANTGAFASTITLSTGSQVTAGADYALDASSADGAASVRITGGSIIATNDFVIGAAARSEAGQASVTIAAGATIETGGFNGSGALAFTLTGSSATISSGGNVTTHGDSAVGLAATALGGDRAGVTITGGNIATGGAGAHGAMAQSGNEAGILMTGGSIQTAGAGAHGLFANTVIGLAHITAGGSITTTGDAAYGVQAVAQSGGAASVLVTGSIATMGLQSQGARAVVDLGAGNVLVENRGSVSTGGDQAAALYATVGIGTGGATVRNSGSATTAGAFAPAILAHTNAGGVEVDNSGILTATGPQGDGIVAETTGIARVTSSGSITASGAAASGIHIDTADGGYTIGITGGSISGGSTDAQLGTAAGIMIDHGIPGGSIAIGAGATVTALSGVAIRNDADGAMVLTSQGRILGDIVTGGGNDRITLGAGSVTRGAILLGAGDDGVTAQGADMSDVARIDGGAGNDSILLQGSRTGAIITGVEALSLTQGSAYTLNADLVMGDFDPQVSTPQSRTGSVAIDAGSALAVAGTVTIRAADPTALVTVTNAGLIQVATGRSVGNSLTIAGNYIGQNGTVALNTVLAGDGAASDRLLISGGRASGSTALRISNIGGAGAQTAADGIRVVQAIQGGTTDAGAFRLDTRVTAGAFEYQLFRGGSAGAEDWYLRSFLMPTDPAAPAMPLYRPEAALLTPGPALARQIGLAALGTVWARRDGAAAAGGILGKESEDGIFGGGAWARAFGERSRSRTDGTLDASATGDLIGLQAGFDVIRTRPYAGGHRDQAGVYVAYSDYSAPSVTGFALGQRNLDVGRLHLDGPSLGAYWTHTGPSGWYVDAVVQATWFDLTAKPDIGSGMSSSGTGYAASLGAGYPVRFGAGRHWQIEPQAQVSWQSVAIDGARVGDSGVAWDAGDSVTGRLGARLQYTARAAAALWQPYARIGAAHTFAGTDRLRFDGGAPLASRIGDTSMEFGGGVSAQVNASTSFFGQAEYRVSVDGGRGRGSATQGSIGIRVTW